MPRVGEKRIILVHKSFNQKIGDTFITRCFPGCFFPPDTIEDTGKCVIVYCRFDSIVKKDDFNAWIQVTVNEVFPIEKICDHYSEVNSSKSIYIFDKSPDINKEYDICFDNNQGMEEKYKVYIKDDFISFEKICQYCPEAAHANSTIWMLFGSQRWCISKQDKWEIISWDDQSDLGETKYIYTDDNGNKHLVMQDMYDFGSEKMDIGNIVNKAS